jgi:hypothetical protein
VKRMANVRTAEIVRSARGRVELAAGFMVEPLWIGC